MFINARPIADGVRHEGEHARSVPPPPDYRRQLTQENTELRRRIGELEKALRHTRQIAEAERRAAALARESAARAWRVATMRTTHRRREDGPETNPVEP